MISEKTEKITVSFPYITKYLDNLIRISSEPHHSLVKTSALVLNNQLKCLAQRESLQHKK